MQDEHQLDGRRRQETHAIIEQGNQAFLGVHCFADVLKDIQNGDDGEKVRLTKS